MCRLFISGSTVASPAGLLMAKDSICTFSAAATVSASFACAGKYGLVGFPSTPTLVIVGIASLRSSMRLPVNQTLPLENPVRLLFGRARLAIHPCPTGSEPKAMPTMGTVSVAFFAAATPAGLQAAIT